jgi:lipoyl synthase
MPEDRTSLAEARRISWERKGRGITFFLPGMFILDGVPGRYPALSLTGGRCELMCDHCRGSLLAPMIAAESPAALVARCRALEGEGHPGVLISGGCDADGCLPWERFLPAIRRVKATTRLHVSVHAGFIGRRDALGLKRAGVDQALVDLIGDDGTLQRICHVPFGVERVAAALEALQAAGIPVVPHIVCGIDGGRMVGEERALDLVARFRLAQLVVVAFMGLPGTPLHRAAPPPPEAVAGLIARARLRMPDLTISLGCARPRGTSRLDVLAVDAGVNRMALPSEEAIARARHHGLAIRYQRSCCSVPERWAGESWATAPRIAAGKPLPQISDPIPAAITQAEPCGSTRHLPSPRGSIFQSPLPLPEHPLSPLPLREHPLSPLPLREGPGEGARTRGETSE